MGTEGWEMLDLPPELQEYIEGLFPGLTYEEALQDQENLYQLFKISSGTATVSDNEGNIGHGQASLFEGGSSHSSRSDLYSQLALEEAVAESLQDFEDKFDNVSISEPPQTAAIQGRNQDDMDPDRMTYEQLQTLGEAVGTESRGLSENEISRLPYTMYRRGFFRNKGKNAKCVICYMKYKEGQYITTLPCTHQYHRDCINRWLEENKTCPICLDEVTLTAQDS
ncbi:hypothetical protein Ancab_009612 [Ancistrocladus abbreviatus]